jgi:hypothetical protein
MEIRAETNYSVEKDGQVVRLGLGEIAHLMQRLSDDGVLLTEASLAEFSAVTVSATPEHIFITPEERHCTT